MVVCMNKERYLKLKKDFIVLYLARNGIMTFLITLFTFSLDLSNYYQISFPATIPYIFFNNIFTLMYFCLLWIFNYLLFELFKIINEVCCLEQKVGFVVCFLIIAPLLQMGGNCALIYYA